MQVSISAKTLARVLFRVLFRLLTTMDPGSRPSWERTYLEILKCLKNRSLCIKVKTASLLVRNQQIIAMGYNGTAPGSIECNTHWREIFARECKQRGEGDEAFQEWTKTEEFRARHREWSKLHEYHAEENVLDIISSADVSQGTCDLYTWFSPCVNCARKIIKYRQVVRTVWYAEEYRHTEGIAMLKKAGISCAAIS